MGKNPLIVVFTDRARRDIERYAQWLRDTHSNQLRLSFLQRLAVKISPLDEFPFMFRASERYPGLRECPITSHALLYYQVNDNRVELLFLRDVKQAAELSEET